MSKQKFGLGKGLGALLPSSPEQDAPALPVHATPDTVDDGVSVGVFAHVEVRKVKPNPYQPRTEFDAFALKELAQSIKEHGLVQPVTVRRFDTGYQLISGERRLRACQEAGLTHIPAYIRKVETQEEMIELALIENIQRETLNPIEIALAYQRLVEDCGYTQDQVAEKVGKNRATVANFIRLLKLPKQIQESIQKSEVSMGHARALINVPTESAQIRIWKRIVRDNLAVRKVEELAREASNPTQPKKKKTPQQTSAEEFEYIVAKLRPVYGTKVHIAASKDGRGHVSFEFYSREDLERIIDLLLSQS